MSRTYLVSFIKTLEIEAEDMDEAIEIAQGNVNFYYDEIEVSEIEFDEEEDDDTTYIVSNDEDFESLGIGQYKGLED
jgi:hypothetical protein